MNTVNLRAESNNKQFTMAAQVSFLNCLSSFVRLIALGATLFACSARAADYPTLKLPSGREVGIIAIGTLEFSKGGPAWWLRYETHVPIDKVQELQAEALEVWEVYRGEVERSGKLNAALSANEPSGSTFVRANAGYNFVFQKQPDGSWKML